MLSRSSAKKRLHIHFVDCRIHIHSARHFRFNVSQVNCTDDMPNFREGQQGAPSYFRFNIAWHTHVSGNPTNLAKFLGGFFAFVDAALAQGKSVLVVAHAESLRAIMAELCSVDTDCIVEPEPSAPLHFRFERRGGTIVPSEPTSRLVEGRGRADGGGARAAPKRLRPQLWQKDQWPCLSQLSWLSRVSRPSLDIGCGRT